MHERMDTRESQRQEKDNEIKVVKEIKETIQSVVQQED